MAHLSGLIHLSLLLATFLPTFLSQFNENHIDSEFADTNIDMGLCRRECLELNQNAIVRMHEKDNSILAGLCYNATKLRSDYFSSYHLHLTGEAKSIIISYICDRETGKWKYDRKHSISLYETSNYTCPEVQKVLNLRSCPITDMFLKSIDMHFNDHYQQMGDLFELALLNLSLATFLPVFPEIIVAEKDMGLCRKECLERNERAIVQMHVEENLLLAQVCYDIFDKRGKNRLLYTILYEADVIEAIRKKGIEAFFAWYICDPAKGVWKYNVMPPEDAFFKPNTKCPPIRFVPDLRSCPPIRGP